MIATKFLLWLDLFCPTVGLINKSLFIVCPTVGLFHPKEKLPERKETGSFSRKWSFSMAYINIS